MKTAVFRSPALRLSVFRSGDGSVTWEGTYNGMAIKFAMPVDGDCVIMLDPDASKERVFRNLLRVECNGRQRWLAELPADPDTFLDVQREGEALMARTWSGFRMRVDAASGKTRSQEFTK
ncbi:MAG TPA: hypothetical protein VGG99_14295 [Acetobacteraceae bacterium]|jgi:hypothetical protein